MHPGNAEHGVVEARAFRRQSRRIFHVFIRAKTCSTRARTYLWDLLWSSFQPGSSVWPRSRRCGMTSPVPG